MANETTRDHWIVRDEGNVLHVAQLARTCDRDGRLLAFQIATGCAPIVKRYELPQPTYWAGSSMPTVAHGGFTIVEWHVREAPTCLACVVVSEAFQ